MSPLSRSDLHGPPSNGLNSAPLSPQGRGCVSPPFHDFLFGLLAAGRPHARQFYLKMTPPRGDLCPPKIVPGQPDNDSASPELLSGDWGRAGLYFAILYCTPRPGRVPRGGCVSGGRPREQRKKQARWRLQGGEHSRFCISPSLPQGLAGSGSRGTQPPGVLPLSPRTRPCGFVP